MVARLFRLRIALSGGFFRGSLRHALRAVLWVLGGFAAAVLLAFAPAWLFEPGAVRTAFDVLIGTLVLGFALLVPFFDSRHNLSPRQLAPYPASSGTVALSLLLTTAMTLPFLMLVAWLVTLSLTRPEWGGWIEGLTLALIALFVLVGVRFASGLSQLLAGDRYAGRLRLVGGLLGVAALPVLVFAVATNLQSENNRLLVDAAAPLSWTPFGAGFAAISEWNAGDTSTAGLRLLVLGGSVLLMLALWFLIVHVSLNRIARPIDVASARQGLGWFERFAARPAPVIAARQITYWTRDPRYRIALLALPVAPIAVVIAFLVAGADLYLAAVLPLPIFMLLLGWSQHNDIAMDSTAIWEHVASGIKGRADRAGRLAPIMLFGVPIAVIGSSLTVTFMGDWRVLPAVLGMNLGVLCIATGVTSVFSALMPYPATRPGDSPFMQPQWSGSGAGTSQTLSMLFALAFSVPPVLVSAQAIIDVTFTGNLFALGFGVGFGLLVLIAGVAIGGRIFDKHGPEILAVTQLFD